jgi:hypothetical protein
MLPSLLKSLLPHRVVFPQRRRFRDNPPRTKKGALIRLIGFFIGGLLLANLVLLTSAALRGQTERPQLQPGAIPERGPLAAIAAERTASATTDGRAVAEPGDRPAPENPPVVHKAAIPCTGLAREKLMTGLTHYYLQRNLRPRAPSEGVADTASITNLLAGPGDPAATTPDVSCTG